MYVEVSWAAESSEHCLLGTGTSRVFLTRQDLSRCFHWSDVARKVCDVVAEEHNRSLSEESDDKLPENFCTTAADSLCVLKKPLKGAVDNQSVDQSWGLNIVAPEVMKTTPWEMSNVRKTEEGEEVAEEDTSSQFQAVQMVSWNQLIGSLAEWATLLHNYASLAERGRNTLQRQQSGDLAMLGGRSGSKYGDDMMSPLGGGTAASNDGSPLFKHNSSAGAAAFKSPQGSVARLGRGQSHELLPPALVTPENVTSDEDINTCNSRIQQGHKMPYKELLECAVCHRIPYPASVVFSTCCGAFSCEGCAITDSGWHCASCNSSPVSALDLHPAVERAMAISSAVKEFLVLTAKSAPPPQNPLKPRSGVVPTPVMKPQAVLSLPTRQSDGGGSVLGTAAVLTSPGGTVVPSGNSSVAGSAAGFRMPPPRKPSGKDARKRRRD